MKRPWERPGILVTVILLGLVAQVLGRATSESSADLAAAKAFQRDERVELAIEHYRRAIRWSFPSNPHATDALSTLRAIAVQAEAEGQTRVALSAWRSLLGGLEATRFLFSGLDPERENARAQIARLVAIHRRAGIDANLSTEQLAADHQSLLDREISPKPLWGALLLSGMAAWIGALSLMAWRGFDATGRFHWTRARGPLWGVVVGFVSFTLGLLFA